MTLCNGVYAPAGTFSASAQVPLGVYVLSTFKANPLTLKLCLVQTYQYRFNSLDSSTVHSPTTFDCLSSSDGTPSNDTL